MPLGIRPIVDFAFKKTFGTPENRACLISLLNAVLRPKEPIVDVTLENPFNPKDFQEDKLSQLDVKAVDRTGAIYNVEVQLRTRTKPCTMHEKKRFATESGNSMRASAPGITLRQ